MCRMCTGLDGNAAGINNVMSGLVSGCKGEFVGCVLDWRIPPKGRNDNSCHSTRGELTGCGHAGGVYVPRIYMHAR